MAERRVVWARLGGELRRLRTLAGVSQVALGIRQATVSQIENGMRLPTAEQAEVFLALASPGDRKRVTALLDAAHLEVTGWDEITEGGHVEHVAAAENAATVRARNFQTVVIPGLLQVPGYAEAVFTTLGRDDVASATAARVARQSDLYRPGTQWEFLIAEHLLDCAVAPDARAAQLRHLAALVDRVELGIVPDAALVGTGGPFIIFTPEAPDGADYVALELPPGRRLLHAPEAVAAYVGTWGRLREAAAVGPDALAVIAEHG